MPCGRRTKLKDIFFGRFKNYVVKYIRGVFKINTLGDLTQKSELEMMKIRNLGKKSLKEVMDKIKEMGLKFREED